MDASKKTITIALSALFFVYSCFGWTYVPVSDMNLISTADSIVLGTVVSILENSQTGLRGAWTHYDVSITDVVKPSQALKNRVSLKRNGDVEINSITVSVLGGYDPELDSTLHVTAAPTFEVGDQVLLFLSHDISSGQEINQIAHFALGVFRKIPSLSSSRNAIKEYFLVRPIDLASMKDSPSSEVEVRKYAEFIQSIVHQLAHENCDDEEEAERSSYWGKALSDELIENTLESRFKTFKFQQQTIRWNIFDSEGSVAWQRDPVGQPGLEGGAVTEIRAAMAAWNNQINTPISYVEGDTTTAQTGGSISDGINSIIFEDPKNVVAGSYQCGVGGTLALGGWWTSGKTHDFRGITFATIIEADIVVQDGVRCWFEKTENPSASYANMLTHEFGHTLGLDHSCGDTNQNCIAGSDADKAVMRASVHNNQGAVLGADDNKGIEFIYSTCYPNCPESAISEGTKVYDSENQHKVMGLSKQNSMIVGSVVAFAVAAALVIVVVVVILRRRNRFKREQVRSRSNSLIIDPYDHIDIPGYVNAGPQSFISPTRISYHDHFQTVTNNLNQIQKLQNSDSTIITSMYKAPRSYTTSNVTLHVESEVKPRVMKDSIEVKVNEQ